MIDDYLRTRGIDPDDAVKWAGLREVRKRLVIPWLNADGEEVYATSRTLTGDGKKWNNKEGSRPALYASPGAWESTRVALVEGQLDAIVSAQAGTAAFATCSSSLSTEAVETLAGKDEVILAVDADDTGMELQAKAIRALSGRVDIFTVKFPAGCKDLCEIAEKVSPQAVADVIASATAIVEPWLENFLAEGDSGMDWLLDGCIAERDRLIITGREGVGKSYLCQQIALQLACGIHPFTLNPIQPVRVAIVDCENDTGELRRRFETLLEIAGSSYPEKGLVIYSRPEGVDLGGEAEDQEWLQGKLSITRPQILFVGPIYKLADGDPNSEVDSKPAAMFIDAMRAEFGIAVVMEAHQTHDGGKGRPYGWSGWRRWPEIGLCLGDSGSLQPWRAPRHATPGFPNMLERGGKWPFVVPRRERDVLWDQIAEHARRALTMPSLRHLETSLSVGKSSIDRAIQEHQEEWDQIASEK